MNIDEIVDRINGDTPIGGNRVEPKRRKPFVDLFNDDCRNALKELDDNSVDAVVTDPPYGLEFMGKHWDYDVPGTDIWQEVLRVLKPGGHLLSFGGSRTYHRMAVAIEDAGFEIRDQIMWLYGSGFPKSSNQDGDWDGWGTALKPAHEPIVMARKPLIGTMAKNLAAHGVGALNIDGCRVDAPDGVPQFNKRQEMTANAFGNGLNGSNRTGELDTGTGRWPANVIHDGSDEVLAAFPDAKDQIAKVVEGGDRRKDQNVYGAMTRGSNGAEPRDQGGSAARFFYCAKASKQDRDIGLTTTEKPVVTFATANGTSGKPSSISEGRNTAYKNTHPTVKPTNLMRYLVRLVTPPGGTVLDPFMGSGSTGRGAILEGFNFIGVEMSPEYFDIADARIAAAEKEFME
jgi:DNA modification methylase